MASVLKGVRAQRSRNYCFTINFKGEEDENGVELEPVTALTPVEDLWDQWVKYCRWQLELSETNTLHYQGYVELKDAMTLAAVKAIPGLERAHFEPRKGSADQADAYCDKEESRVDGSWTFGKKSQQGKAAASTSVKRLLDDGAPMERVQEDHFGFWLHNYRALAEYKRGKIQPRDFKSTVLLFVGPSGVGKTTLMHKIGKAIGSVYIAPGSKGSGCYFDGYDHQDVFILDEFDGGSMRPTFFNLLCDAFPCELPVHGRAGHQMTSRYILIGSNYAPKFWWKNRSAAQVVQTTRRIDAVFKVGMKARSPAQMVLGAPAMKTVSKSPTLNGSMTAYVESMAMNGVVF